ncbi:DMT family transporter [Nocardioides albus]|uniref:Drug/metabolite transporter (DMT)-like permease n=1 Tax=Nocardioides albus TaxID=1841 RepID=A0A7W5FA45_9ACTN|nr:DMT family transporter [Nocardioides albus]MBB3090893.1 drug/metabolite transporter (DMT)-like permease [Nocardioides albus]
MSIEALPRRATDLPGSRRNGTLLGIAFAAAGMACVGSSVAVSTAITDAPLFTLQAVRYALAALLLLVVARVTGWRVPRPRGREWRWLAGVATAGLVLFNVGVVRGVAHAEPAVIGVAVAAVPMLLAVVPAIATRTLPARPVVVGATVVTAGAVLVQGFGRTDAAGIGYALLVLACEAGFTLLAIPVLARLGAFGVSFHAVWMAAAGMAVVGVATEGPAAVTTLGTGDLLAALYLAVVVTTLAFLLWFTAVNRLGSGRAGLLTGVVPVTAAALAIPLDGTVPNPLVWAGTAVVAVGLCIGLGGVLPRVRRSAPLAAHPGP